MSGPCCKRNCVDLAIVVSIIIGIIAAIFRYTAIITVTPAFLWVALGIAIVYLLTAFFSAPFYTNIGRCTCKIQSSISAFLIGALGTILLSLVLLAIEFAATSIIGAIITGGLLAFLALVITSTACIIKSVTDCICD